MIKQVVLRCEISDNLGIYKNDLTEGYQIDYCLWNHADGIVISKNSDVYTVNTTTAYSCDLTIHGKYTLSTFLRVDVKFNILMKLEHYYYLIGLYEKDLGDWSCRPDLKLLTNLSLNHTIHLVRHPRMVILKSTFIYLELLSARSYID